MEMHGLIDLYSENANKEFLKLVKKLTKSGTMSAFPPLINDTNANIAVEDEENAELLNNYFTGISTTPDSDDDQPFQLLSLAKDHWRGFNTRNAHMVHLVNLILFKMVYTS